MHSNASQTLLANREVSSGAKARSAAAASIATRLSSSAHALTWLVNLRWHAVLGQLLAILIVANVPALALPVGRIAALVGGMALSNAVLAVWLRREPVVQPNLVGAVLAFDCIVLTGVLALAGGPLNPFVMIYLIQVTLGGFLLDGRWAAGLAALATAGYAALFLAEPSVSAAAFARAQGDHRYPMWLAFGLTALGTAYVVGRVAAALRDRQEALQRAQEAAARTEKLASLSTLAAGAAHELATPLGTIAVASAELEDLVLDAPDDAIADARLIRAEVERCRTILERMAIRGGQLTGELPTSASLSAVLQRLKEDLPAADAQRVSLSIERDGELWVPLHGLLQVLTSLVQNGLQADGDSSTRVLVKAVADRDGVRIAIEDGGKGIPAELLGRVGEPFFTTKPPGKGMGLGVFLARAFVEHCGGTIEITSGEARGTSVALRLPFRSPEELRHGR